MESQWFYCEEDAKHRKMDMFKYVYWYPVDYNETRKRKNEEFKRIELNQIQKVRRGKCNVPEGVISIGWGCFYFCVSLEKITLPYTLKSIRGEAFRHTSLREVVIPEGVTWIGHKCFYHCFKLRKLQLPSTLEIIDDYAFHVTHIEEVNIPEGVTSVGEECFSFCQFLNSVHIPSTLASIYVNTLNHTCVKSIKVPSECKILKSTEIKCDWNKLSYTTTNK